ncbi:MAG TPA: hypothetical protein DCS28_01195 [Candidatus Moranbacteria bacterium]|nr:hypothetical protein [Candidatus Moranbacteria bacterium]HAT74643.1 hypothetical protein [Candidatus Moranbacteria bacterium]
MKSNLNNKVEKQAENEFVGAAMELLNQLPERTQDIFKKRFGLSGDFSALTLDKIGRDYGITRERIRQIIADFKKVLYKKREEENFKKTEDILLCAIKENYDIIKKTDAIAKLNPQCLKQVESAIKFLADCSEKILPFFEKGRIEKSWLASAPIKERALKFAAEAENIFQEEAEPLAEAEIVKRLMARFSGFSSKEILNYLKVLARVKKNKFGKWGMHHWPEISPGGSREKIYLVLKEEKKPLHFSRIAELIDEYKLGKRKAHPQTIHNELIKDKKFVLIGRGIYALSEWGYSEGVLKDVIKDILEKNGKPMKREEIIAEVLKARKVKKTTVIINLNNNKIFKRTGDLYGLKK